MAAKWVKSLHCKSRAAANDVVSPTTASCRNSSQSLKDVVPTRTAKPESRRSKPVPVSFFPSLSDLPAGHPSRNVVEIIFRSRWSSESAFPGRVEMVFKIHNSGRAMTRFEEYRESVKSRAGSEPDELVSRCAADGNEMMRFHCLGPSGSAAWGIGARIGTYSGSGAAHDSYGGGKGRRLMLVCRVISGRVGKDPVKGFISVNGGGAAGELLVVDARAVLPCFLVVYRL